MSAGISISRIGAKVFTSRISTVEIRDVNTFAPIRLIEMPADMTGFVLIPPGPGPARPAGSP